MITVKLRRIGNSLGVILPAHVITGKQAGDTISIDVITNVITKAVDVITSETKPAPKPYTGELSKGRQTASKGFRHE